jgi:uracil-DNA glycosylase
MKDFTGNPEFPIWLIGHSPPKAWADKLDTPLDPRHPARHSIWTSVADPMQDRIYRQRKLRLDTFRLYIRNAMKHPFTKLNIQADTQTLKEIIKKYKPTIILTFGVAAFSISLLASGETPPFFANTTRLLGEQFRNRIENFHDDKVNVIPLLHVSIALKFLASHRDFVGTYGNTPPNYFDYVGTKLADLLLAKLSDKPIWID